MPAFARGRPTSTRSGNGWSSSRESSSMPATCSSFSAVTTCALSPHSHDLEEDCRSARETRQPGRLCVPDQPGFFEGLLDLEIAFAADDFSVSKSELEGKRLFGQSAA